MSIGKLNKSFIRQSFFSSLLIGISLYLRQRVKAGQHSIKTKIYSKHA